MIIHSKAFSYKKENAFFIPTAPIDLARAKSGPAPQRDSTH